MSDLSDKLDLLRTSLETALPGRIVTRSFEDAADLKDADLERGIVTIATQGEGGYNNLPGREAMYGTLDLVLVGRLKVKETDSGEALENAEFILVEEIKAFVRALPAGIDSLEIKRYRQSGQIERPYGWVLIEMEMML